MAERAVYDASDACHDAKRERTAPPPLSDKLVAQLQGAVEAARRRRLPVEPLPAVEPPAGARRRPHPP